MNRLFWREPLVRQKGSHRRFEGVVDGQNCGVTVAGKEGDEMNKATLASIRRQSNLPRELFRPS
ncbi:MAG: type II toxin-antitoxin system HicA family toxin [Gammaproteobacteria bacterium]|nr:type II toxin-antitoxin system HicA family toxin [Gammaproteobacteria bacterium]MCY4277178.1 type II toxin-antitoxin system HicA family toxin [Gammaproteobacteria bacterium]